VKKLSTTFIILSIIPIFSFSQEIHCKLIGKIINRNSNSLILIKGNDDPRKSGIKIPIIKDSFYYDLKILEIEQYSLIFDDDLRKFGYQPISFYSENCTINFTLYSSGEFEKNIISGGQLNDKKHTYVNLIKNNFVSNLNKVDSIRDSIYHTDNYYSYKAKILLRKVEETKNADERSKIYKELDNLKNSYELFSPETMLIINKQDSIYKTKFDFELKYINENLDIFSYSLILQLIQLYPEYKKLISLNKIKEICAIYFQQYPDHPYTLMIKDKLKNIDQ
jgi:hypothetical protein